MKKFVICILGIGLPIYLLPFILRGDLDRFNPIAEEKNSICRCERIWCSRLSS